MRGSVLHPRSFSEGSRQTSQALPRRRSWTLLDQEPSTHCMSESPKELVQDSDVQALLPEIRMCSGVGTTALVLLGNLPKWF